ncbi:CDP-glycerol glycerophosphotransferase family protein [Anaerosporobacter faecicola]|uniref:CDP-glycerol glycerophosphotransferase family protein n=1 Tax=Anaerosporobacter faecicola TaxID=2718714 RepID=UPI001EE540E2|nr:CDP-glycerol glycerophosphotransferase family protein [Anaerosporobacter faecicola]
MKNVLGRIRSLVKQCVILLYRILTVVLPLRKDVIVFGSNLGRNYSGNPKAIYENMVEQGYDQMYRIVWFFEKENTKIPGQAKVIKYGRLQYLYYMAVAKVWVFDCRQPKFLVKRKGVTYIQTWHGTPLKKLALDMKEVTMAEGKDTEEYKKDFYDNAQTWDYLLSQNSYSTAIFRRAFAFYKTMVEVGYPRNDYLIKGNTKETIERLKQEMGLPLDKKVILYAPTWRDDEFYCQGSYKFNPSLAFHMFMERLKEDYVCIVKYHYLIEDAIDWSAYKGFIYNYDKSYDITNLYLVSDLLITDYSSVMFDYSILKRPMFFYAYDLDKYKDTLRGFYFDFVAEVPGPISLKTEDLIDDILHYDKKQYEEKYKKFCETYNHLDHGHASEEVVAIIKEKLG